jgi:hypothetical protein
MASAHHLRFRPAAGMLSTVFAKGMLRCQVKTFLDYNSG